jgi:hypothetical protein
MAITPAEMLLFSRTGHFPRQPRDTPLKQSLSAPVRD